AMMRRELGGAPERVAMGVDQAPSESAGQRGLVEPQGLEEMRESLVGRDLAVIDRATALRLAPALAERLVAPLEADVRRVRLQDRVQEPGRRADGLAVDLDLGHPLTVEADQRVEQVEQDRGVRHQSGFLMLIRAWRMSSG